MTVVWRLVREKHAATTFSGVGAAKTAGRFNSLGTPVVYTSDSYALAMLEVRVHVATFRALRDRVAVSAEIDDDLVEVLEPSDLPPDCRSARPRPRRRRSATPGWRRGGRPCCGCPAWSCRSRRTTFSIRPTRTLGGSGSGRRRR